MPHPGASAHRSSGRSARAVGGWIALAAAGIGLGVLIASPGVAPLPAAAQGTTQSGQALYLENCASCHGPQGQGTAAGPTQFGAGEAVADFYLRTCRMPQAAPGQPATRHPPRFTDAEIKALVARVAAFGPGPSIPQVSAGAEVQRGFALYTANCAACHAATGSGNAVGGGYAAVGLGVATPTQIGEAMLIGPGVMPRFAFADPDRDAIVAYVEYLRGAPHPGGAPIGGFGPVSEGFVSVFVGLTLLVLAARFAGRRWHSTEPVVEVEEPTGAGPDDAPTIGPMDGEARP
ncbi:MAG: c-type cytochrome [Chloroflexota bacterium]